MMMTIFDNDGDDDDDHKDQWRWITICNSRPAFVLGTTTVAIIILQVPAPIHTRRSTSS